MTMRCHDCHVDTMPIDEYYMVHPHIWRTAVMAGLLPGLDQLGTPPIRFLCIGCLEARVGRRLTRRDFTDAPINTNPEWWRSDRLTRRLTDNTQKHEQLSVLSLSRHPR